MNKKKMFVMSALAILVGLFAGANVSNAQYVPPSTADETYTYYYESAKSGNYTATTSKSSSAEASTSSRNTSNITCNSATVYGEVWANGTPTTVWFEWGPTSSLGNATPSQTKSTDGQFSRNLTNLSANTTYYVRAMAANQYGSSVGSILTFRTLSCGTPTSPTPTNTSCSDGASVNLSGPSTLNGGQSGTFQAHVVNTGSSWWYHGDVYQFVNKGSLNISPSYGHLSYRVDPGQSHNWTFSVTAPTTPGTYTINLQNVHRAGGVYRTTSEVCGNSAPTSDKYFGETGSASFTVASQSSTPTPTPAPTPTPTPTGDIVSSYNTNTISDSTNSNIVSGNTNSNININSNNTTNIHNDFDNDGDDDDDDNDGNSDEPEVTTRSATNVEETSATLNGRVDGNGSDTTVWFEYSTDRDDIDSDDETDEDEIGSGSESFSDRITGLRRNTTYYFRAVAENDEGEDFGSILSFRTGEDDGSDDSDDDATAPTAVTTPATGITSTSAQLNSLILSDTSDSTQTWFEWGPTTGLGRITSNTNVAGSSFRNASFVSGLTPGATYYFRAVAENSDWRNVGATLSFTTPTGFVAGTSTTNVVRTTTIVNRSTGEDSLIMLTIDCGSEFITENERRECLVKWENIAGETLRDVVLQVVLPKRMSFEAASDGDIKNDENILAFDIGTLREDEEGELAFIMKTDSVIEDDGLMVVVAQMVYTDENGATGDALAYSSHRTYSDGSALGAFAFGAGFLPTSLFGWLLLIILILALLLLAKQISERRRPEPVFITPPPTPPTH